jgi:hypothetical protein
MLLAGPPPASAGAGLSAASPEAVSSAASPEAGPPEHQSTPQATPPMSPSPHPAPPLRARVTQGRAAPPNRISAAALRTRADVLFWALSFLSSYLVLTFLLCDHPSTHSSEELHAATLARCFELPTQHLPSFLQQLLQAPTSGFSFPSARSIATSFPDLLALFALGAASIAAALLTPSWSIQRRRSLALTVTHLLPNVVALWQLVMQRRPLDAAQQQWFQVYHFGAHRLLLLTVWKLFFAVSTTLRSVYPLMMLLSKHSLMLVLA